MTNSFKMLKSTLMTGLLASTTVCWAAVANAQDVNLKSADGSVNLTGELSEVTDESYIINTEFGQLRVQRDFVECFGDGCPTGGSADPMVVSWDVSLWGQRRAFTEHVEKLSELLADRTDGKFTLNLSYGGLSGSRENLDGIAEGAFEMAQFCASYHPEKNPSITVLELPFLGVSTFEQEVAISKAVYAHPATREDMARWNATLLMPSPQPQNNILGVGFPPTSLAGFEGLKVRAGGGVARALEAMGAETVQLPAPDVQGALESGDIAAVAFAPHAHMAFNTIESGVWWTTNLNPGTSNCPVVMNSDAFDALPDEYKVLLASASDEALDHYVESYKNVTLEAWLPTLREREIIELTINDEILNEINAAVAAPAAAAWIAENTAAGLPAKELYDLVVGIIAEGT